MKGQRRAMLGQLKAMRTQIGQMQQNRLCLETKRIRAWLY
jgi:hypothetical protein